MRSAYDLKIAAKEARARGDLVRARELDKQAAVLADRHLDPKRFIRETAESEPPATKYVVQQPPKSYLRRTLDVLRRMCGL